MPEQKRYPVIPPNIQHVHEYGDDGLCVYCLEASRKTAADSKPAVSFAKEPA